jgi:hypothetical protein
MYGSNNTNNVQGQVRVMKAVIPRGKLGGVRPKTELTCQHYCNGFINTQRE